MCTTTPLRTSTRPTLGAGCCGRGKRPRPRLRNALPDAHVRSKAQHKQRARARYPRPSQGPQTSDEQAQPERKQHKSMHRRREEGGKRRRRRTARCSQHRRVMGCTKNAGRSEGELRRTGVSPRRSAPEVERGMPRQSNHEKSLADSHRPVLTDVGCAKSLRT